MNLINQSDLIIPDNRQRREFDEKQLSLLAESIEKRGLMHPIVVRNDGVTLIAGERRNRAIAILHRENRPFNCNGTLVPRGQIPVIPLTSLSPLELEEAELEENTIRVDLTIQEHALAVKRLHQLRTAQHGEFDPSTGEGWTRTKTAEELAGRPPRKNEIHDVGIDLLIAENLDDPFVQAAGTRKEALKAIRERKKHELRQKLAAEFDPAKSPHTLIHGDSYVLLAGMKDEFDCIVADPPYGIDIHEKEFWDGQRHEYDDSDEEFQKILHTLPSLLFEAAKQQCHLYLFCDIRRFFELSAAFEVGGWTVWPRPLIWDKGNTGSYGNIEFGFRATYDCILFANKGKMPVTAGYGDQFHVAQPTNLPHPAGKPTELYIEILKRSVYPGYKVLDCFCGHGPIFPAASKLHCVAVGIEKSPKYHQMAIETLTKLQGK